MLEALGATLRAAREARGWTLEEVERATRIRARYLAALESGDINSLPSPLQARGFLRNYAGHLGLNPEQTLTQLDEALKPARRLGLPAILPGGRKIQKPAGEAASATPASPFAAARRARRLFTPDILIGLFVLVVIVGFFAWGGSRLIANFTNPSQTTPTAELIGPTDTPTPTLIANITATLTPPPPVVSFSDVQLTLEITQRTFVRVVVDGALTFEGLLLPDDRQDFAGKSVVEVTTGNGAGVRVILNQRDLGLMGGFAEVVSRQYVPTGMITLTPTITLTPSETPTPSDTPTSTTPPTETLTLTPSRTPRP
ncbi:MAG: DUF4115 domain-containing protein [Chloroflexi bacterium]|nr:DUF4115 domain-containing protein [Chloroflexota bacterium]